MLFNSYEFILFFLPFSIFIFFKIGAVGHHRVAIAWLVAASLFFYGWWNPAYLWLILFSILFNYSFGVMLANRPTRKLLTVGIACNLAILGYYKYANFFVNSINFITNSNYHFHKLLLPLAISFFTFQQITYLVDAYRGETREYNFLHYCLFVTFFPQLIAGPIVHHKEMLPQFAKDSIYRLKTENLSAGLTIFFIGLFKKVIIADELARYAQLAFDASAQGMSLSFFEAWRGAFAYGFQLYFDFSGYSDMAIGIARIFGIILPLNFFSPYRAMNIIDFWRRWHITLSRFLRDYLYIPLGGNRKGKLRRHTNLMTTMLLGGLWHGAGWTFVFWGGLHGLFLVINHGWRSFRKRLGQDLNKNSIIGIWASRTLTLLVVMVAWVFFRAENFDSAMRMLEGMAGYHGFIWPELLHNETGLFSTLLQDIGWRFEYVKFFKGWRDIIIIGLLIFITWFLPNTQQIMAKHHAVDMPLNDNRHTRFTWSPNGLWLAIISTIGLFSILKLSRVTEFLYFQF